MLIAVGVAMSGRVPRAHIFSVSPTTALALILVVGGLGMLESRRVNEHRFFANLGVSSAMVAVLVTLPAVCGEILIGMMSLS